jgi:hypothetical protein
MAVPPALSRLAAGAEVALAVSVLAACAGSSTAQQSAGGQPSAAAGSGSTSGTAASAPGGQPPPGSGRSNPTPTRASLLGAFSAAGDGGDLILQDLPDGASCTVTARRKGRSEQLSIAKDPQVAGRDSSLQFTLSSTPDGATIEWSATCALNGETRTIPYETRTQPSQGSTEPPSTPPSAPPSHTATSTPAGPTPTASHS